ncbi:MAG: hypothetical protein KC733_12720, partial [Candidatus Omnitrophica bacterium]|nr:hypothetical protein [Candidatus Omnitrophota bacterium]
TIHSGEVAWWKVLNDQHTAKTLNIYAVPEKIEVLKRDPLYKRFHVQKKTLQSIIALLTLAFLAGPAWAENVSEVVSKQLIDAGTGYLQSTAFVQMVFSVLQNASLTILLLAIFGITIIVGNFVKVSWKSSVVAGVALVVLGAGLLTTIEYSKNTTRVIIQQQIEKRIKNPQERIRYAERHGLPVSDKDREQSEFMEIQKLEAASRFQCGGSCTEGQRVVQEVKYQGRPVLEQMKVCECVNGMFKPDPQAVIEEAYNISKEKLGDAKETPSYKMTDPNLFYKEIIEEVEKAEYDNPWEKRLALELLHLHADAIQGKSPSGWDRVVRSDNVLPGLSIFGFIPGILLMLWIWNVMLGRWERYRRLNAERTGALSESRIPWREVTFAIGVPLVPYLAFISFDYFGLLMSAVQFVSYLTLAFVGVVVSVYVLRKVIIEDMIRQGYAYKLWWTNVDAALYRRLESALGKGNLYRASDILPLISDAYYQEKIERLRIVLTIWNKLIETVNEVAKKRKESEEILGAWILTIYTINHYNEQASNELDRIYEKVQFFNEKEDLLLGGYVVLWEALMHLSRKLYKEDRLELEGIVGSQDAPYLVNKTKLEKTIEEKIEEFFDNAISRAEVREKERASSNEWSFIQKRNEQERNG